MISTEYDIRDYGAIGDGITLNTCAIQSAIDECSCNGGGIVFVPRGVFLTGTIRVKDNVELHLANTAKLLGSTDLHDYATGIARCGFDMEYLIDKCLIYAENAENIAITGRGIIDGQGASFPTVRTDGLPAERPMLIRFYRCRHILIKDVDLRDAASWCTHLRECFDVRITGIDINSKVNANNDGIDLMSTKRARISDCSIFCLDDAICFQNMSDDLPVEDVVITNCVLSTRWAAIRSGGAHKAGIRNIAVSNCVIKDTYGCGIKLQISGSGSMENMTFSNIVMNNVSAPISLRFGNYHYNGEQRNESYPWGTMRNIMFSNIWANILSEAELTEAMKDQGMHPDEVRQCISICGIPEHPISGISISDMGIVCPGGGTSADAANLDPPERENDYPEYYMWGILPAYGLYARHIDGLSLNNVRFELIAPDERPAMVFDDADRVDICGLKLDNSASVDSLIKVINSTDKSVKNCNMNCGSHIHIGIITQEIVS